MKTEGFKKTQHGNISLGWGTVGDYTRDRNVKTKRSYNMLTLVFYPSEAQMEQNESNYVNSKWIKQSTKLSQ